MVAGLTGAFRPVPVGGDCRAELGQITQTKR
jgi:hypothetical protein